MSYAKDIANTRGAVEAPKAIIISLAGSDSFAGAGIQADIKTAHSLNAYCATVLTAITAQNSQGVQAVQAVTPEVISAQLSSIDRDIGTKVGAIKIGMLGDASTTLCVAKYLGHHFKHTPIVLDTVIKATSGGELLDIDGRNALIEHLIPLASVITPNLLESALILNGPIATNQAQMIEQAYALLKLGATSVLLKGGHLEGESAIDILVDDDKCVVFDSARIDTQHTHGTGCTLSTAIAVHLACNNPLDEACQKAKDYVTERLDASKSWQLVDSNGPLCH